MRLSFYMIAGTVLVSSMSGLPARAASESVIVAFDPTTDPCTPRYPESQVVAGAGVLYGTSYAGGCSDGSMPGAGTVFELIPPATAGGSWQDVVLHTFGQNDEGGILPYGPVLVGKNGELYGMTSFHSHVGAGAVYELTPPPAGQTAWGFQLLHIFGSVPNDGAYMNGGLIADSSGRLYGAAPSGGAGGFGIIFMLTPPPAGSTQWGYQIIHQFCPTDGEGPNSLIERTMGGVFTLFGTAQIGGTGNAGTVFSLAAPQAGQTSWSLTTLYNFIGGSDGQYPFSGLSVDKSFQLYGTTQLGGEGGPNPNAGSGIVFKLIPSTDAGKTRWTELILHRFQGGADGDSPMGGVVEVVGAHLFGTTSNTAFELTPITYGGDVAPWNEKILHEFPSSSTDGNYANAPLLPITANGVTSYYGTTSQGGNTTCSCGTVFVVTP